MKRTNYNTVGLVILSVALTLLVGLVSAENALALTPRTATSIVDLNGDGISELMLVDQANGQWHTYSFYEGVVRLFNINSSSDRQVIGDYNGDGLSDFATAYDNQLTGEKIWHIEFSSIDPNDPGLAATQADIAWGLSGEVPVPADYDGDGKTDLATFSPITGVWNICLSLSMTARVELLGSGSDNPVPSDYDGDGSADIAVMQVADATWRIHYSKEDSLVDIPWDVKVTADDVMVPADYDGDAHADLAIYRVATGFWVILESGSGNFRTAQFGGGVYTGDQTESEPSGENADRPMPGDFDGDGVMDIAVWSSQSKVSHVLPSQSSIMASMPVGNDDSRPVSLCVISREVPVNLMSLTLKAKR